MSGVHIEEPRWSPGAQRWLYAPSPVQHQVGRAVAARHTWLVAWADFIPVLTGLGAARATRVVHRTVFTLRSQAAQLRLPMDMHSLPLTCPCVGDQRLTVTVLVYGALTHIRDAGSVEQDVVDLGMAIPERPGLESLALTVSAELDLHGAGTGVWPESSLRLLTHLVSVHTPRLSKGINVKLEVAVTPN